MHLKPQNHLLTHTHTHKKRQNKKNGEDIPILVVAEIVLVQRNLINNQYKQKSEVLCTFRSHKSYAYLLNVKPSNFVLMKMCTAEFDEIIITFTYNNNKY